jgi:hypothetical protein
MEHLIKITVSANYTYLITIELFDSNNRTIAPESRSDLVDIYFKQYPGIYKLRVTLNGAVQDEVFFLDSDKNFFVGSPNEWGVSASTIVISPPTQFTAATLGEAYGSSHEYYTYPSIDHSQVGTNPVESNSLENNSLYIFLRFSSREMYDVYKQQTDSPILFQFKLVDETGYLIYDFNDKSKVAYDLDFGWLAFNMMLPNGLYYLIYSGKDARQIPIYVFKDWHTQFFMMLAREPQFGSIRTFLSPERRFIPDSFDHKYIDTLLDALQNNDYSLEGNTINIAAQNKFQSPMLGLLCSYLYLKGNSHKNDSLFNIMVNNIKNVILKDNTEAPDLIALEVILNSHVRSREAKHFITPNPPMFRIGFEAILQESLLDDKLIPILSMNDYISENLFYDSPYTTFKPVDFKKINTLKSSHDKNVKDFMKEKSASIDPSTATEGPTRSGGSPMKPDSPFEEKYFDSKLNELLEAEVLSKISNADNPHLEDSWLKSSVAEIIREESDLSMIAISERLGISKNTVMRILIELSVETRELE